MVPVIALKKLSRLVPEVVNVVKSKGMRCLKSVHANGIGVRLNKVFEDIVF